MTDAGLIELVEQRPPEDLSGDELSEIRSRLAASPALREAVLGQLRLDQALHQSVGQFRLPVELLLVKAAAIQSTSTIGKLLGWGSITALVIGVVCVGTLVSLRNSAPPQAPELPAVEDLLLDEPVSPSDLQPGPPGSAVVTNHLDAVETAPHFAPVDAPIAAGQAAGELLFAGEDEAAAWRQSLESVAGEVSQRTIDDKAELVLRGTQVLKHAWPAEGRLRLKLAEHDRFRIHLSHSAEGGSGRAAGGADWLAGPSSLTLEFFAQPRPLWVAWLAARRANQIVPEILALAAHDEGRLARLGADTIDLTYHHGQLLLTHGHNELLAAPLSGAPDRIVLEGDAVVQGLEFAAGLGIAGNAHLPDAFTPDAPLPADREWQCELPTGAKWNLLAEGRVELMAEDSPADARAACSADGIALQEIVFQLEDPLPGTGIYLGDDQGEVRYRLGFVADEKPNRVCFALSTEEGMPPRVPEGPATLCPARPWFKMIAKDGVVKAWFSCDGLHWSPLLDPDSTVGARLSMAGVYCLAGPGTRSIRIAHFAARGASAPPLRPVDELFGGATRGRRMLLSHFSRARHGG